MNNFNKRFIRVRFHSSNLPARTKLLVKYAPDIEFTQGIFILTSDISPETRWGKLREKRNMWNNYHDSRLHGHQEAACRATCLPQIKPVHQSDFLDNLPISSKGTIHNIISFSRIIIKLQQNKGTRKLLMSCHSRQGCIAVWRMYYLPN